LTRNASDVPWSSALPPRAIEITGVAGSGKSTTARLLCRRDDYRRAGFIHARRPWHLLQIVRSVPQLRTILRHGVLRAPRIRWPEVKLLAYVERGWILERGGRDRDAALVFDQGPLYALVRLTAEARAFTRHPSFASWRQRQLRRWAERLTVIAWLDAPDDVLWDRINSRDQAHREKGNDASAGKRFLRRYRAAFEELLLSFERVQGPAIVRIDTAAIAPDDAVAAIVAAVEGTDAAAPHRTRAHSP
jgi:thymidylate kinase